MNQKMWFAIVAAFAVAAMSISVIAQSDKPTSDEEILQRLARLEAMVGTRADNERGDWKLISAEVGLMVREHDRGVMRARMYILRGDAWAPVAVDGYSEVAPDNLLL